MNEWDKILSGDLKDKIKSGFMVIGENLSDHTISTWHADNEESAVRFAKHFCDSTGGCYEIVKYEFVGVVRPQQPPIEFFKP